MKTIERRIEIMTQAYFNLINSHLYPVGTDRRMEFVAAHIRRVRFVRANPAPIKDFPHSLTYMPDTPAF